MGLHFIQKCRDHGTVYGQCRCPDPSKMVDLVNCEPKLCAAAAPSPVEGRLFAPGDWVIYQPAENPPSHYWQRRVGRKFLVVEVSNDGTRLLVWDELFNRLWGLEDGHGDAISFDAKSAVRVTA